MNVQQLVIFFLEILYYTLFFGFCRKSEKFYKLFVVFLLSNVISFFIGYGSFYSYALYFVEIAILMRIMKIKMTLYDILILTLSMIFKLFIELIFFIILRENINTFLWVCIMGIAKNNIVILLHNQLNKLYCKLKNLWVNNNFYIRYLFSTFLYLYLIFSVIYIILRV